MASNASKWRFINTRRGSESERKVFPDSTNGLGLPGKLIPVQITVKPVWSLVAANDR